MVTSDGSEVWHEGCLQVWKIPLLYADQSEGCPVNGEDVQGAVSGPLQLRQGSCWGDSEETWNQNEGAPGCLSEGELEKSVLAEHAWESYHPIKWDETTVGDQARNPKELLLKEAIHIRLLNPPPPPQQGWGTGSAWMLDGSPGSTEAEAFRWCTLM